MANAPIIVSIAQLREELGAVEPDSALGAYLRGFGATVDKQDKALYRRIHEAQSAVETELGILFFQTRMVSRPLQKRADGTLPQIGVDFDAETDAYPYTRRDFAAYGTVILRKRPVYTVQRAGLRYGNTHEQMAAAEFPQGWISTQARTGVLHVLPIMGTGGQIGAGAMLLLPLLGGAMPGSLSIPLIFNIDYTAGWFPRDFDPDEDDFSPYLYDLDPTPLIEAVKYGAAARSLRSVRRAVAPGGGSISMDGFSQSWGDGRFESEIEDYENQAKLITSNWAAQLPIPLFSI